MAIELAPHGVTVNCVSPGVINGGMFIEGKLDQGGIDNLINEVSQKHITNKIGQPNEIAEICLWLTTQRI